MTVRPGPRPLFGDTIFAEMSALAARTGSINLGQGFPDVDGPDWLLAAAAEAVTHGRGNQYPSMLGIPDLREAISAHQKRFYDLDYAAADEILVSSGATEAIAASILAYAGPGDEVVVFEPYYDSYTACVEIAGATRRTVMLRPEKGRWTFDPAELAAAITDRTRLIVLNSPHNPTGTVFTDDELATIADLAVAHDLLVLSDEVYEHLTFDAPHRPIATLPRMRERTLTVSSAGKTFSVTGWKIGWVCAPQELLARVLSVRQWLTFTVAGPLQYAVAVGLGSDDAFYSSVATELRLRRDVLVEGLSGLGFDVLTPQATYFATVDLGGDATAWARALPERAGVVAIPSRVFYDSEVDRYVRFAFCKQPEILSKAVGQLTGVRP